MLSLSKRTDYALVALSYLSDRAEQWVCAREIAAAHDLPAALLMNLLKELNGGGVLLSSRGSKGGYRLAKSLDSLSLFELIEMIDGPFAFAECQGEPGACAESGACRLAGACPIRPAISALHRKIQGFLKEVKVAELVVPGRRIDVPLELVGVG